MLHVQEELFDSALNQLSSELEAHPPTSAQPLPCDRWVARSVLQKAIRRGQSALAQRALRNLLDHDERSVWRHLTVIAVEDVGVANLGILDQLVAARRDRKWRRQAGGDLRIMNELVRQMAVSNHCQATCDLLLRAVNDPSLEQIRSFALEAASAELASLLWNPDEDILHRGIYALALGGGLAEGQNYSDPHAVLDIFADIMESQTAVDTCREAWKACRNPMTLLLPIINEKWVLNYDRFVVDDECPAGEVIEGVPGYALDQFTRIGNNISRALLSEDDELKALLNTVGISSALHSRAVGDLLFLVEGGHLTARTRWPTGDLLRHPFRQLSSVSHFGSLLPDALEHIRSKARQIDFLRSLHFHPVRQKLF